MTNPHTALEDIQRRLEAEPDTTAAKITHDELSLWATSEQAVN